MDFNDSNAEAEFREEARSWLQQNVPRAAEAEGLDKFKLARFWQKRKSEGGWACIGWPEEFGGRDATPIQQIIFAQEEMRANAPPAHEFGSGVGLAGPTLMAHGSVELKEKYLPKIVTGEHYWCQLFSEPSAGSDLAGLRTRAERHGDGWIINGQKVWTSFGDEADAGMLIVRTDPNVAKHKGLTYFIVDMNSPGIERRHIKQMNGEAEFFEVYFTDVFISDVQRVGEVGHGWQVATTTLMAERFSALNEGADIFLAIGDLIKFCQTVNIDSSPAIENDAVASHIADWYCIDKGMEYTNARLISALSRGDTPGPESSIGKLVLANLTQEMSSFAMDLMDESEPGGYSEEISELYARFEYAFMKSPGIRILGGTDEIMLNIIAERVLGMPAEHRADKGLPFCDIPTSY